MLFAWSVVCFVGWGFFLLFKCCFNSELFLKLHSPDKISVLSAGMSPVGFSVLLCTKHSAQLPATVPSAIVPVMSVSDIYLVNPWFLIRLTNPWIIPSVPFFGVFCGGHCGVEEWYGFGKSLDRSPSHSCQLIISTYLFPKILTCLCPWRRMPPGFLAASLSPLCYISFKAWGTQLNVELVISEITLWLLSAVGFRLHHWCVSVGCGTAHPRKVLGLSLPPNFHLINDHVHVCCARSSTDWGRSLEACVFWTRWGLDPGSSLGSI